jgi:hypothetical protein
VICTAVSATAVILRQDLCSQMSLDGTRLTEAIREIDISVGFRCDSRWLRRDFDLGYSFRTLVGLICIAPAAGNRQASSVAIPSTRTVNANVIGSYERNPNASANFKLRVCCSHWGKRGAARGAMPPLEQRLRQFGQEYHGLSIFRVVGMRN